MKLAEALMERKDLTKKMARLKEEIMNVVLMKKHVELVKGDDSIDPKNKELLLDLNESYVTYTKTLENLNNQIDRANHTHLTSKLNELRRIDAQISLYNEERNKLLRKEDFNYGRDEQVAIPAIEVSEVTNVIQELESQRRIIDREIQKRNWEIEI